jgi:RNA-directed DNA polymerase
VPSTSYLFGGSPRISRPKEFQDITKLLAYLEISAKELAKICVARSSMYHSFEIASKKKTRRISAPDKRLKHTQTKIKASLEKIYQPRSTTHGFIRDRSIVTNTLVHAGRRHILNIDLKSFFPSITERRVFGLFSSLGFDREVCDAITKICTHEGSLPQGAPSSPIISNMICFSLDRDLHSFSKLNRVVFTRYADDITVSTNGSPVTLFEASLPPSGKLEIGALSTSFRNIFSQNGFELNEEKIHFASGSHRKIVTGLIANEFPNVPRRFISQTRAILYKIEKDGYSEAEREYRTKFATNPKLSLDQHLRGNLNHISNVRGKGDPLFRSLADKFNKCLSPAVTVDHTPMESLNLGIWLIEWQLNEDRINQLYIEAREAKKDITSVIESGVGTAFFLEGMGLVSAEHCSPRAHEQLEYFHVFHPSKPTVKYQVSVKARCEARDVCILNHEIPMGSYRELKACRVQARSRDIVRAYGFPDYQTGDDVTSSAGEVSHIVTRSTVKMLNLSFKIGQGMSGGPILDKTQRVVGLVHKGGPGELRDYGVAIDAVLGLSQEA